MTSAKTRLLLAAGSIPSPTRAAMRRRAPVLAVLAFVAMVTVMFVLPLVMSASGGLAHARGRPFLVGLSNAVGCAAIAGIATWAAFARGGSMVRQPRLLSWSVVIATPLLLGAWTMLWHATYEDPAKHVLGWRCFLMTVATAPWPFAALAAAVRRIEPLHPGLTGAVTGAAAGAWAGVTVALWCPLAEPGHVLRGHVLPFVVLAALGAVVGRRLFSVR